MAKEQKGEFIGAVHIAKDISERKNTEARIQDSEIKYKALYETSKDAVMIVDFKKGFIAGNPATIEMFGFSNEQEFISKSPSDVSPEYQPDGVSSLEKSKQMMARAIQEGSYYFEWKHKRKNEEEFFATVLLTRLELEGQIVLQATVRDISKEKELEEELKRRIVELERFQRITVGRELKMKELKARIAELEGRGN
ncbi:MAG: PAS domain S-box protein [Candidatus Omnitrophica bacterium]|nr:PAS domain S-box protein [Candidatus Omnitrophota bacterium]